MTNADRIAYGDTKNPPPKKATKKTAKGKDVDSVRFGELRTHIVAIQEQMQRQGISTDFSRTVRFLVAVGIKAIREGFWKIETEAVQQLKEPDM